MGTELGFPYLLIVTQIGSVWVGVRLELDVPWDNRAS